MPKNPIKTKGSNLGAMPKNPKKNEGIEFEHDAGEPEIKEGIEHVQRHKERVMPQSKASISCQKPTTTHKVKVIKLEIWQTFIPEEKPFSLIHNIQYPPTINRGYAFVCASKAQIS